MTEDTFHEGVHPGNPWPERRVDSVNLMEVRCAVCDTPGMKCSCSVLRTWDDERVYDDEKENRHLRGHARIQMRRDGDWTVN